MKEFMAITKALSDESRVRILLALRDRELCVCQLIELIGLAPSTVSKHMSILKQARLIEGDKKGKWVYYHIAAGAPEAASEAVDWVKRHLVSEATIKRDTKNLRAIIKQHPIEVCRKQKACRAVRTVVDGKVAAGISPGAG